MRLALEQREELRGRQRGIVAIVQLAGLDPRHQQFGECGLDALGSGFPEHLRQRESAICGVHRIRCPAIASGALIMREEGARDIQQALAQRHVRGLGEQGVGQFCSQCDFTAAANKVSLSPKWL